MEIAFQWIDKNVNLTTTKKLVARQVFLVVTQNDQVARHTIKYDMVMSYMRGDRGCGFEIKRDSRAYRQTVAD